MEDVLNLYATPYDPGQPLICFDEKPYQMIGDVLGPLPPKPGVPRRIDYHYKREGVCNILCAFEPATGQRFVKITGHVRIMPDL